jgi:F0F1-type ATP synthase assembly protein I
MNKYIVFAGIGFELIGLIVVSVYAGEYLDARWPSKGLWVAGLILLSLVGWMIQLVFMLKNTQKKDSPPSV